MRLDIKSWLRKNQGKATLLGICPMCEEIIQASLKEAAAEKFIPMFVASPRQVDARRGYTGWSQRELVEFIRSTAEKLGYTGPYLIARDHGGPYQSKRDRGKPGVSLAEAMGYAKEMFTEDLRSGFDLIHVDATEDGSIEGTLELGEIARRTAELVAHIEEVRAKEDFPKIYYEVGTEEISGGMTEPDSFEKFIQLLKNQLADCGHEQAVERLLFIVGQVGTVMRIDMTNRFDPKRAKALVDIASRYGLFLKVHYTDWLESPSLEQFPKLSIGGANVGPEFAASVVEGLGELEREEVLALREVGGASNFVKAIEEAAVKEAPWQKFAPGGLGNRELREFAQSNRREIAICVGRYVLKNPAVVKARQKLYENLKKYGCVDKPDQFVIDCVRKAIRRYVKAFNLGGTGE